MINVTFLDQEVLITGEQVAPDIVFECGQAFRFENYGDEYIGVAHAKVLHVKNTPEGLSIKPVTENEYNGIWQHYFDFDLDYEEIGTELSNSDESLKKAVAFSKGMRLLNQDPFETLISFIISANNNIKRIKGIIQKICSLCGKKIYDGEDIYYAFPTPEELGTLSTEELIKCGCGYRTEYIFDTVKAILNGFDLLEIYKLDYLTAKKKLMTLKGVGPKVADCVLLFAFGKKEAFPQDVWIKRVLEAVYGFKAKNDSELIEFVNKTFGKYAGIAQQYLFHYARMNKLT